MEKIQSPSEKLSHKISSSEKRFEEFEKEIYPSLSMDEKKHFDDLNSPDADTRHAALWFFAAKRDKKFLPIFKRAIRDSDDYMRKTASSILAKLSDIPEEGRLYSAQTEEFFAPGKKGTLGRIKRGKFEKSGSETILLGGELVGKAIIRKIDEESFLAWKKAYESKRIWFRNGFSYTPCEPIIEKSGKLMAKKMKDGYYRVYAKVLGKNLYDFLGDPANEKYKNDLDVQQEKILKVLDKILHIDHGHPHDANFCVEMHEGGPRLYLIDFDQAKILRGWKDED